MNRVKSRGWGAAPILLAALVWPALLTQGAAPAAPAPPASTNASPTAATPPPQSVFVTPISPKQGRNPFFPRSTFSAAAHAKPEQIDTSGVVLNGLTSPPRVSAMINGRTFEPGETGEIRLRNGVKVTVRCLEIKSDVVVAIIGSQRCELRLRHAL